MNNKVKKSLELVGAVAIAGGVAWFTGLPARLMNAVDSAKMSNIQMEPGTISNVRPFANQLHAAGSPQNQKDLEAKMVDVYVADVTKSIEFHNPGQQPDQKRLRKDFTAFLDEVREHSDKLAAGFPAGNPHDSKVYGKMAAEASLYRDADSKFDTSFRNADAEGARNADLYDILQKVSKVRLTKPGTGIS